MYFNHQNYDQVEMWLMASLILQVHVQCKGMEIEIGQINLKIFQRAAENHNPKLKQIKRKNYL